MKPIDNTETLPDEFITDVRSIIENGRKKAYDSIIRTSIKTFWDVGKRIVKEEQKGKTRARYGTHLIKNINRKIITGSIIVASIVALPFFLIFKFNTFLYSKVFIKSINLKITI